MTRWILRGVASVLALVGFVTIITNVTFAGAPVRGARLANGITRDFPRDAPALLAAETNYTLYYSFSSDPNDLTYVATFTPDVKSIYAWGIVEAKTGAPEKQFKIDVQFLAPDGTPVDSEWYNDDTGTVTTFPEGDDPSAPENRARKVINVAGTPNADLTGQWTVNYTIGGKLVSSGNFTLEGSTDISNSDNAGSAEDSLTDAGYEVVEFTESEGKNGNKFAFTIMLPASTDLYSSETTQQIVDGLAALRQAYPNSETLYVFLRYDSRYEIAYFTEPEHVDAYIKNNDFDELASNITVDVYDNQEGKYLGKSSKDFINKNFGAGNYNAPPNPPLSKKSTRVGSVRVTISPQTLPADGKSKANVSVEVFDKKNKPLVDTEVAFEVSGSATGTLRPRSTSTDEEGKADTVFTVGSKNGSVTITATSGGVSGAGTIIVGAGSDNPAADNVIALLAAEGYEAKQVAYLDSAKTAVGVLVDLGTSYNINDVTGPIIYGMFGLRTFYPDAKTLAVIIPYQNNLLIFPSGATDYDTFGKALSAAKTDANKKTVLQSFLTKVFAQSAYVDKSGKKISTFKDFYDKNFTGG